jgi:hypothetical protein
MFSSELPSTREVQIVRLRDHYRDVTNESSEQRDVIGKRKRKPLGNLPPITYAQRSVPVMQRGGSLPSVEGSPVASPSPNSSNAVMDSTHFWRKIWGSGQFQRGDRRQLRGGPRWARAKSDAMKRLTIIARSITAMEEDHGSPGRPGGNVGEGGNERSYVMKKHFLVVARFLVLVPLGVFAVTAEVVAQSTYCPPQQRQDRAKYLNCQPSARDPNAAGYEDRQQQRRRGFPQ